MSSRPNKHDSASSTHPEEATIKTKSDRNNSWVMLAENGGYTPLPGEQTLYQSPPRTTLSLQTSSRLSPSDSYSQQCKSGVVYLTNRRIIYLPVSPTPALQSFAVPILNVADSRVTAPWFGANKWEAIVQPVQGGGIPPQYAELDLVMEFKEGGAFDFSSIFERLKERLRQAVDVVRESSGDADCGRGVGALNLNNVHLEDLPAYEESRQHTRVPDPLPSPPMDGPAQNETNIASPTIAAPEPQSPRRPSTLSSPRDAAFEPPSEPPPGYEEVQRNSIVDELERRLREEELEKS